MSLTGRCNPIYNLRLLETKLNFCQQITPSTYDSEYKSIHFFTLSIQPGDPLSRGHCCGSSTDTPDYGRGCGITTEPWEHWTNILQMWGLVLKISGKVKISQRQKFREKVFDSPACHTNGNCEILQQTQCVRVLLGEIWL